MLILSQLFYLLNKIKIPKGCWISAVHNAHIEPTVLLTEQN
jgi:hypothetical protein